MDMRRAFMAGRDDHGREGEVLRRDGVHVRGHAGAAGADVAHLRAAEFRVVVSLEFQGIPVVLAGFIAGDAGVHPAFQVAAGRLFPAFRGGLLC
ncbi:hypothetical protein D9M73_296510 [compost metagenome]